MCSLNASLPLRVSVLVWLLLWHDNTLSLSLPTALLFQFDVSECWNISNIISEFTCYRFGIGLVIICTVIGMHLLDALLNLNPLSKSKQITPLNIQIRKQIVWFGEPCVHIRIIITQHDVVVCIDVLICGYVESKISELLTTKYLCTTLCEWVESKCLRNDICSATRLEHL